jgi:hypothetical protein
MSRVVPGVLALTMAFLTAMPTHSTLAQATHPRVNLRQSAAQIVIPAPVASNLAAALSLPAAGLQEPLAETTETALISLLPADFRADCAAMLASWGTLVQNTERWTVRELHRARDAKRLTIVLAYRCGSTVASYEQAYDERLAELALAGEFSFLQLIPIAKECGNCAELYHLEFSQSFPLERGAIEELRLASTTDNPCCGGPELEEKEQMIFLLLPEAKILLTIEESSRKVEHDDEAGDQTTSCQADLQYMHDAAGHLLEITAGIRCNVNGAASLARSERFRWNPQTRQMETTDITVRE